MTEIRCPKCGTASFAVSPIGQSWRLQTRCTNIECRSRFTVVAKRHAANTKETVVSVGFSSTDKERNGAKRTEAGFIPLDVTALGAMPLNELHKLVNETEDFISALCSTYEVELERLTNFYRRRKFAAEEKRDGYVKEHKPREVVAPTKKKQSAPPEKAKVKRSAVPVIALTDYRTMLFGFLATMESSGHIAPADAVRMRADSMTEEGLMRLADRLGMPRVK